MAESFICGVYDRAEKTLKNLSFVLPPEEEQRQNYKAGDIIYVGSRVYKLGDRQVLSGGIIQYGLLVVKEKEA